MLSSCIKFHNSLTFSQKNIINVCYAQETLHRPNDIYFNSFFKEVLMQAKCSLQTVVIRNLPKILKMELSCDSVLFLGYIFKNIDILASKRILAPFFYNIIPIFASL